MRIVPRLIPAAHFNFQRRGPQQGFNSALRWRLLGQLEVWGGRIQSWPTAKAPPRSLISYYLRRLNGLSPFKTSSTQLFPILILSGCLSKNLSYESLVY